MTALPPDPFDPLPWIGTLIILLCLLAAFAATGHIPTIT